MQEKDKAKAYEQLTINEKIKYWKMYQRGLIHWIENEKNNFFVLEKIILEIKYIQKKIKNLKIKSNETFYN